MKSAEEIVALYRQRRGGRHPLVNRAMEVRELYDGRADVVLPELSRNERPAVANLLQQGLDQTAMRIASTMPSLFCPPQREGVKRWEQLADMKRKALLGWMWDNEWEILLAQRARHLIGYASSPVVIRPPAGNDKPIPTWQVRDPISAFPGATGRMNEMTPPDCVFAFTRTYSWLKANYPMQAAVISGPSMLSGNPVKADERFDVIEYLDADEITLVVTGRASDGVTTTGVGGSSRMVGPQILEQLVNKAGVCPVVMPGRIVLDADCPQGQFDGMLGMFQNQARLAALELIAIEQGIFEEQWIVSRPNEKANIITLPDSRQGIPGEITGGEVVSKSINPGYKTTDAIDRLERYQRLEGRIPADFGGESASNVRTDRRGNSIMSATVDFTVMEAQHILARSQQHELPIGMAVAKAYTPQPATFYVNWKGARGWVDYQPEEVFDSPTVFVRYSLPGTDVNGLGVAGGQRLGMGTLDPLTFMELDPMIDNPTEVMDRVVYFELQRSVLAEMQQPGSAPVAVKARVADLVITGKMTVFDAVAQAQKEEQERQSSTVNPAAPGSPEAQVGIAPPGTPGTDTGIAAPAGTKPLSQMIRELHTAGTMPTSTPVPAASAA